MWQGCTLAQVPIPAPNARSEGTWAVTAPTRPLTWIPGENRMSQTAHT